MWESDLYTVPTAITEIENEVFGFDIYPNPTTGKVLIKGAEGTQYSISDMQGRVVAEGRVNTEADLSGEAEGIYVVTVNGETQRLILRK